MNIIKSFFIKWPSEIISNITAISLFLMMLHIAADVIMRYFFNSPLPGTMTVIMYYYMIVVVFASVVLVERSDAHIRIELLTERFPLPAQRLLRKLSDIGSLVIYGAIAFRGYEQALAALGERTLVMEGEAEIITWPTYFVIPVCILVALFIVFGRLFENKKLS